jgi:hypothetical protein
MPYGETLPDRIEKLIKEIPIVPERSDSLWQQMSDLRFVAMRLGMMYAANEIFVKYVEPHIDQPKHNPSWKELP